MTLRKKIGFVVVAATVCWFVAGLWICHQAPKWIAGNIEQLSGGDVKVGRVRTNFINSFFVKDIRIIGPLQADFPLISISLRPWKVFQTGRVFFIEFHRPVVTIDDLGVFTKKNLKPTFLGPFSRARVLVSGGKSIIRGSKIPLTLTELSGRMDFSGTKVDGNFTTDVNAWGAVDGGFRADVSSGIAWDAEIQGKDLDIEKIWQSMGSRVSKLGVLKGKTDIVLKAKSLAGEESATPEWSLKFDSTKAAWARSQQTEPLTLTFHLNLNPSTLVIESIETKRGLVASGIVRDIATRPQFNVKVEANNSPLSDFLKVLPFEWTPHLVGGDVTLKTVITGDSIRPEATGIFSISASYSKLLLPPVTGQFLLKNSRLEANAGFADGTMTLHRSFDKSTADSAELIIHHLSLREIGRKNEWENVNGILNSRLTIKAPETGIVINGDFNLDGFQWGRLRSVRDSAGTLEINKNQVIVKTQDKTFSLQASLNRSTVELAEFNLDFGNGFTFGLRGTADFSTDRINMTVSGKKIQPDLWPPLVARYPAIEGSLDMNGTVMGNLKDPEGRFDLVFHNLKFNPRGGQWNGTTELVGTREKFLLRNIHVDGGYNGQVSWLRNLSKNKDIWAIDVSLLNANPQLMWDVLKSSQDVSGSLSGNMNLEWDGKNIIGASSITWVSGNIGNFRFDTAAGALAMSSGRIEIAEFSILRGARALRAEGSATPVKNGWDYNAVFQLQRWGEEPFTLDGELRSAGRFSITEPFLNGKVWAPALWMRDRSIENVNAVVRGDNNVWNIEGTAGEDTRFKVQVNRESNRLSGSLVGSSFRVDDLVNQFAPQIERADLPMGRMDLRVAFSGTTDAPEFKLKASLSDGSWRDETFSSEVVAEVTPSTITILTSKTDFIKGGSVFLRGDIDRSKEGILNLTGTGSDVHLNSLFRLLNWTVRWDGTTDLAFMINGNKEDPHIEVNFTGQHEGLGPFRGEGSLQGTVRGTLKELDLSGIHVESGEGYVKLLNGSRIFLDRTGAGTMRLAVETRNVSSGYLTFFGNAEIAGSWQSKKVLGSENLPPVEIDVFARSLWINQFFLDGNVTHLTFQNGEVEFSPIPGSGQQLSGLLIHRDLPSLEVKKFRFIEDGVEKFQLDGFVGSDKWDFALETNDVDATLIRGLFDTTLPVSGPVSIRLKGRGSVWEPDIEAKVNWKNGNFSILPLDSAECDILYKDGILRIQNISAQKKKGYQLTGFVQIGTGDMDRESHVTQVDMHLDKGDLAFLSEVFPDVSKARGNFEGRLQMNMKTGKPVISGYFTGQKIFIQSVYTPLLEKGVLDVRFDKNQLIVHRASATIGAGTIVLGGSVDVGENEVKEFKLYLRSITEEGISLRIPQLAITPGPVLGRFSLLKKKLAGISRGEPTINLSLTGPGSSPTLAGEINLKNTVFTYPPSKSMAKDQTSQQFSSWWRSFCSKLNWDLKVNAGSRTWYQNELVDALVTGSMSFSGPTSDLSTNGRIQTEQGSIVYSGNEFKIKNAELEIETRQVGLGEDDSKKTFVYLRAVAEKEVYYTDALSNNNQDTIVMVVDRSLLGEIQPRFYSRNNPNLSSQRAFQLALGLPFNESIESSTLLPDQRTTEREKNREETDKILRIGLVQLLDSSLASPLARAIAQHTGLVDFIRVTYQDRDPYAVDDSDVTDATDPATDITQSEFLRYTKGTKVKFGRGLSRRLFADYSFRVDEYQEKLDLRHEVELAYRLHQNFFLRGITELDSERTLGRPPDRRAILENQWRFGLPKKKKSKPPEESRSTFENRITNKPEGG